MKAPVLHDDGQVRSLILEQSEVLRRICVDHEQIGDGSGLEYITFGDRSRRLYAVSARA